MGNPIRKYYKEAVLDLSPITDVKHRHFRFRLRSGRFLKVQDKIRDEDALKRWLIRYSPLDVYYSVSTWLNPEILGPRVNTPLLANILIYSDIAFDIDR